MASGKKLAIVVSVLLAGASVAYFFRKDASSPGFWRVATTEDPFNQAVERRVGDPSWPSRSTPPPARREAFRVSTATTAAIAQPKGGPSDGQPAFRPNHNPVGALLAPIDGVVGDEHALEIDTRPLVPADAPPDNTPPPNWDVAPDTPPADHEIRHRVADGDTLTRLAVRYLGRADAYHEIFELNRDVLASPDLLPIGAILRIPPRRQPGKPRPLSSMPPVEQNEPLRMMPVSTSGGVPP